MRYVPLLVALGVGLVATLLWAAGRRAVVFGAGAVAAGTLIVFLSTLLVDCRSCHTSALIVGAFAAAPFFVAGWIGLVLSGPTPWRRGWLVAVAALTLFQSAWAGSLLWTSTFQGRCPCAGFLIGRVDTGLFAVGSDRVLAPLLLAAAVISTVLAWRAYLQGGAA